MFLRRDQVKTHSEGQFDSIDDLEVFTYDCLLKHDAKFKVFTRSKAADDTLARKRDSLNKIDEIKGGR